jgi:hypothetical protein
MLGLTERLAGLGMAVFTIGKFGIFLPPGKPEIRFPAIFRVSGLSRPFH